MTTPETADLTVPVGRDDHVRGPADAPVTLVEYGDFQCPYCRQAYRRLDAVLQTGHIRLVFRHFPLGEIHARAEAAALAAEAASRQGRFWEMHDRLFEHADRLGDNDLVEHARVLGLDLDAFKTDLEDPELLRHIRNVRAGGERSGAHGTPTFFVDGRRSQCAWRVLLDCLAQGQTTTPEPSALSSRKESSHV